MDDKPVDARDEWMRRVGPLYPALVAVKQLTPLPILRGVEPTTEDLSRAAVWFPPVGGIIGAVVSLIALLVIETDLVPAIAGALVVALAVVAGAALHERGFARAVENLIGGEDTDDPYRRRPIGLYGVVAVIGLLAARIFLLLGTDPDAWIPALLIAQIALRWCPIFLLRLGDRLGEPAGDERSLLVGELSWMALAFASGFALLVAVLFGGLAGLLAAVLVAAVAFGVGVYFQRRYGGLSANTLATAGVVCELVVLIAFAAADPASVSPWTS
jgi:adenosylcobinamide-GDP ribazoletransferase